MSNVHNIRFLCQLNVKFGVFDVFTGFPTVVKMAQQRGYHMHRS